MYFQLLLLLSHVSFIILDIQPSEIICVAPLSQNLDESLTSVTVRSVTSRSHRRLAFVVVVARRAFLEEVASKCSSLDDSVRPIIFRFLSGFDGPDTALLALLYDVREVTRLLGRDVHEIWCQCSLHYGDEEAIW